LGLIETHASSKERTGTRNTCDVGERGGKKDTLGGGRHVAISRPAAGAEGKGLFRAGKKREGVGPKAPFSRRNGLSQKGMGNDREV